MTSKERVLTAISHAEPDRVPIGEWEYGQEVIAPVLGGPIKALKPGGGFIFGTSHSIMPAAKYENYLAMLDAAAEHGAY